MNLSSISMRERIRLNLVAAMESANISQVQLAKQLNIHKGTVNNWVRGNSSPDVDMVPQICGALGISIGDYYGLLIIPLQKRKNPRPWRTGTRIYWSCTTVWTNSTRARRSAIWSVCWRLKNISKTQTPCKGLQVFAFTGIIKEGSKWDYLLSCLSLSL